MSITFSYVNYIEDATPMTLILGTEKANFPLENIRTTFRSNAFQSTDGVLEIKIVFDHGFQRLPRSFFLTNEQRGIQLSELAEIIIYGSDDGNWDTPQSTTVISWNEFLITKFSDTSFGNHRFHMLHIKDLNNTDNYIELGNIFLGDSIDFTSTDLNLGWGDETVDDSEREESDGGEAWFDEKAQKEAFDFQLIYMSQPERNNLKQMYKDVGKHKPFYISLDPEQKISDSDAELAIFCRFVSELKFTNPFYRIYNTTLRILEVV